MRIPTSSILRKKRSLPKRSIIPTKKKTTRTRPAILLPRTTLMKTAAGLYMAQTPNSYKKDMLNKVIRDKAYLMVGHGDLTPHINDTFTVPANKYVMYLSNPGISLSTHWLFDPVFESKDGVAQLVAGKITKRGPLADAYKRIYKPGMECANLNIQFFDVHDGRLDQFMGVWKLPLDLDKKSTLMSKPGQKTVKDVVLSGPPGVYIVMSCRKTDTNRVEVSLNRIQNIYKNVTKQNLTFEKFKQFNFVRAQGNVPNEQLKKNYAHYLLMLLQERDVIGAGPTSRAIQLKEFGAYRMTNLKRKRRTPTPTQKMTKKQRVDATNVETLTRRLSAIKL